MKKKITKRNTKGILLIILGIAIVAIAANAIITRQSSSEPSTQVSELKHEGKIISGAYDEKELKSDAEWKKILSPKQFYILRQKGTEVPFTGELNNEKRKGTYYSVGCDKPLFRSEQKFDSGTGWPSFWAPIADDAVVLREDGGLGGLLRTEVLDTCGNHLGHVFDDGPEPTGKRYCMNSDALVFKPDESAK